VPWPPGHGWAHWRRVQFDDGDLSDVDTTHSCALCDGQVAVVEARAFIKEAKVERSSRG